MVNSFTRAAGAAERVLSLYDLTPDIDPDVGEHVDRCVSRWDLAFEAVEFHYQMRPETKVLQGMSFKIDEGHVAALVGRSGGGKSTMVHLPLRFYDPRALLTPLPLMPRGRCISYFVSTTPVPGASPLAATTSKTSLWLRTPSPPYRP